VQAYPKYGSEKKGLPTNYYLTLAPERIRTHCEMDSAEFIPFNTVSALRIGNPLEGLAKGGTVFVQWSQDTPEGLWEHFPLAARETLRTAEGRVVFLDAARIAQEEASRPELAIRMQGIVLLGVFLRYVPFREAQKLSEAELFKKVEEALRHYFGKVSERVVEENLSCVKRGYEEVREIPNALMAEAAREHAEQISGMQVADLMHHGVITCAPNDRLEEVVATMTDAHISAIVVVDKEKRMKGVLSTTDLARARAVEADLAEAGKLLPLHLMTPNVLVTWPDEPLNEAVSRMLDHRVHRLVVVKSEEESEIPIGILSMTDLARTMPLRE
jgi:CBS domain-containing protein